MILNKLFATNMNTLTQLTKKVEGQIKDDELTTLYNYAKQVKKGCIVEIGAYRGKTTLALALGSKEGGNLKVYSIDPHDQFVGVNGGVFGPSDMEAKYRNIAKSGLGDKIYTITMKSFQASLSWNKPVGLIWIDGDHTYKSVLEDFQGFRMHLIAGSFVIFHDTHMEGVAKAIAEIEAKNNLELVEQVRTMKVFKFNV